MRITVEIGKCKIVVDDENSETCIARWKDQCQRLNETINKTVEEAIKLHKNEIGDSSS